MHHRESASGMGVNVLITRNFRPERQSSSVAISGGRFPHGGCDPGTTNWNAHSGGDSPEPANLSRVAGERQTAEVQWVEEVMQRSGASGRRLAPRVRNDSNALHVE